MNRLIFALAMVVGCSGPAGPAKKMGGSAPAMAPPAPAAASPAGPTPPVARREPKVTRVHGRERVDEYAWLERKGAPEVEAYLNAENAYVDAVMRPNEGLQDEVYRELVAREPEADEDLPVKRRGWLYYSRTLPGKQYAVSYRKRPGAGAAEQAVLDPNELAKGGGGAFLRAQEVTDDGNLVAYVLDTKGSGQNRLFVKDLRTGKVHDLGAERVHTVAWAADSRSLFYTEHNDAHRPYRLYKHELEAPSADELIYEERDEGFRVYVRRSDSEAYVLLDSRNWTTAEVRALRADRPRDPFRVVWPRRPGHMYSVDHRGDSFLIRTNDRGPNFRLVSVPVADPGAPAKRKELVPYRDDVMLEWAETFRDFYVVHERHDAAPRVRVVDFATGGAKTIAFPEAVCSVGGSSNGDFGAKAYRYWYMSYVTPPSVYEFDVKAGASKLLKRDSVPGYDPSAYAVERTWAKAPDGARVPVTVVSKKGTPRDGTAPLYLRGYGAYGFAATARFSPEVLPLLDRGVVYAWAHVRGAGDLGKAWHDGGRLRNKRTTFTDFVAAAEHLVAERYAAPGRIAIGGHSAGGMLVGAVANMRPELFRAVVAEAPFVDVVNSMFNDKNQGTVAEYEEWGNPNERAAYDDMMAYSPYDNVRAQNYPALLATAVYNDTSVLYHEPAKWVAKLRAHKTDRNPLLLRTEMGAAGHFGKGGRFDKLRERAFVNAFLLWQLGVAPH